MKKPFFYFEIISRASRNDINRTAYDVLVRCANLGHGHHHDLVIVRVTEMETVEAGIDEAHQVVSDEIHILKPEEYMAEMCRVQEEKHAC